MKQTYDTDTMLFSILKGSVTIMANITGGVYAGQRPDNSVKEDIVVNTITLTQDSVPQLGTSNINIHVADKTVTIAGVQQKVEDRARLKALSNLVLDTIRTARVSGLKIAVEAQSTIPDVSISQHYVNIRITWIIH